MKAPTPAATLRFDRRVRLEFRGATITSDAGLLACRELEDALGLTETADECLQESRGGRNVQHRLVGLLSCRSLLRGSCCQAIVWLLGPRRVH